MTSLIQEEINELRTRLDKLEELNKVCSPWTPSTGEEYFYLEGGGLPKHAGNWTNHPVDRKRLERGNVFSSRSEAQEADRKRCIQVKLERLAKKLNGDAKYLSHSIHYVVALGKFSTKSSPNWIHGPIPLFASEKVAEEVISVLGDELKILFGVRGTK